MANEVAARAAVVMIEAKVARRAAVIGHVALLRQGEKVIRATAKSPISGREDKLLPHRSKTIGKAVGVGNIMMDHTSMVQLCR